MGPVVHVSVSVKPLSLLTRILMMLSGSAPVLRSVTVRTVLVMPTSWLPKSTLIGRTLTVVPTPLPDSGTS
jgi:hypothetical protein